MSDATAVQVSVRTSRRTEVLSAFRRPTAVVGVVLTAAVVLLALGGLLGLTPYDPARQDVVQALQGPSGTHWFGTDQFGRDIFSRVAAGLANSLRIAVVSVGAAALVGILLGVLAGYFGGLLDRAVGVVTNVLFAFPSLLLALALASVLERNWLTVSIAIALVYVPLFVRVARAPVLSLREVEYVVAARATGMGAFGVLRRHILPNIMNVLLVQATLSLNWAILTEAALSFLGFGTPPPAPSLGVMIFESRSLFSIAPWVLLGPGLAIVLLVVGLNLLGDSLQNVLDPRRRVKR